MKVFHVVTECYENDGEKYVDKVQYVTHKEDSLLAVTEHFVKECDELGDSLKSVSECLVIVQQLG